MFVTQTSSKCCKTELHYIYGALWLIQELGFTDCSSFFVFLTSLRLSVWFLCILCPVFIIMYVLSNKIASLLIRKNKYGASYSEKLARESGGVAIVEEEKNFSLLILYFWERVALGVLGFGCSESSITPFVFSTFVSKISLSSCLWTHTKSRTT